MQRRVISVVDTENPKLAWKGEFVWNVERFSEDQVDFCRDKLAKIGISHIPAENVLIQPDMTKRERIASLVLGRPVAPAIVVPRMMPISEGISSQVLRDVFNLTPEEGEEEIDGNLLVNEGIARLLDLLIAAGGTAYNAAGAFIGVGDSNTAEAATQTELQAATNRFYKAMNATFPSRASQTVSWASDFTSAEANYVWAEWSIAAGATTASGSGFTTGTTKLNRKGQALCTKSTGTWTLTAQVTIS